MTARAPAFAAVVAVGVVVPFAPASATSSALPPGPSADPLDAAVGVVGAAPGILAARRSRAGVAPGDR